MKASLAFWTTSLAALALVASCAQQQASPGAPVPKGTSSSISATDLRTRLYIYADDSMMGRETGKIGNMKATRYIAAEVKRMGLEPAGDSGTYFQDMHATSTRFPNEPDPGTARNVIAIIRGSDPVLRDEYVAIGAHNDHIGITSTPADHDSLKMYNAELTRLGAPSWDRTTRAKRDSLRSVIHIDLDSLRRIRPARLDSIRNGADDDGSGTVTVLEIAEALAAAPVKPKRSIIFIWHTGEEKGLLGSKWFTEHPTVPREKIVAQLNMDMVGRGGAADITGGGPDYLQLVGSRRVSTELGDLIEQMNSGRSRPFKFDYQYDANGHPERIYCRSDHYNYARYGIPITFFTTGQEPDYHQVTDEPQYIEYEKMSRIADFVKDVAVRVANLDHSLKVDKPVTDPAAPCVQ
ncbi:MAG: M20/M25/M40 family metallo-hydrolase [Gemmatimonadales bacterium]